MIYVPILKNRGCELKAASEISDCFSSKVIPLFEVINDKYKDQFLVDPDSGKYITSIKAGRKKASKIKLPHTDQDIVTLQYINSIIKSKTAFIDYFRYSDEEYPPNIKIDLKQVELSLQLSRNYELYENHLLSMVQFENLIPVISIKKKFQDPIQQIRPLINKLQKEKQSIAIRLTANLTNKYKTMLPLLRDTDYLLIDLREQNIESQFMELTDIQELDLICNVILLNSPRKASIKNTQYEEKGYTSLIDNSVLSKHSSYDFEGFGDFAGLRDLLPAYQSGSNGKGSALALMYFFNANKFMSLRNTNTDLGPRGFQKIKRYILANETLFNPNNNCRAIEEIKNFPNSGGYQNWITIIVIRYIHQIYISI